MLHDKREIKMSNNVLENWFNKNVCFGDDNCTRKIDNLLAVWVCKEKYCSVTEAKGFDKRRLPAEGSKWRKCNCLFLTHTDKIVLSHIARQTRISFKQHQIKNCVSYEDMYRKTWCGDSSHAIAMEAGLPYDTGHNRNRKIKESIDFLTAIGLIIVPTPKEGKKVCTRIPLKRLALLSELPDKKEKVVDFLMLYDVKGCKFKAAFKDRGMFLKWVRDSSHKGGYSDIPL